MNASEHSSVDSAAAPTAATVEVRGHFGEVLQVRLGAAGPVALVTLPCPAFVTRVTYVPGSGPLRATEPASHKALTAARLLLADIGRPPCGRVDILRPVAPGLGAGSSTAETLGALRAVAAAYGLRLTPEAEARLSLAAEGAIDPLMHDATVLFASREGRVLRRLPPLPPLAVVGGFAGSPQTTDAAGCRFAEIGGAVEALERACRAGDAAGVGAVAEASGAAHQWLRPNPAWQAIGRIGAEAGALGRVISHTGAAIGLLFRKLPEGVAPRLEAAGLRGIVGWSLDRGD